MITAKALTAAAASVRGARAAGLETQASRKAPELLAAANRWLAGAVPTLNQWDDPAQLRRVDAIEAAARDLAAALGLAAFRGRGNTVLDRGYQG